ncbi:MAG: hypothetical protein RI885_2677 [Actinomycetota bacterium]|jgi:hypothetical protein
MTTRPALTVGLLAANLVLLSFVDRGDGRFGLIVGLGMLACCIWLSIVAVRTHHAVWIVLFAISLLVWNPAGSVDLSPSLAFIAHAVGIAGFAATAFFLTGRRPSSRADGVA